MIDDLPDIVIESIRHRYRWVSDSLRQEESLREHASGRMQKHSESIGLLRKALDDLTGFADAHGVTVPGPEPGPEPS